MSNKIGNYICDSIPHPPRIPNDDDITELNLKQQANKERSNTPIINGNIGNDPSTSSSGNKTYKTNSSKSRKSSKSKSSSSSSITLNMYNGHIEQIGTRIVHIHKNLFAEQTLYSPNTQEIRDMPSHVQALSTSKLEITRDDMLLVKEHMGDGWREVARKLGFSKGQIQKRVNNHKHLGLEEVIFRILFDWHESCAKEASIGCLISSMWLAREYECVEKLVAAHSAS